MNDLKKLFGYFGSYKKDLLIGSVLVIAETAFELVIPVLMADIIDVGVKNYDVSFILEKGVQMGICALLSLLTGLLYARYAARAAYGWGANVREAEFEKVQSYAFFQFGSF